MQYSKLPEQNQETELTHDEVVELEQNDVHTPYHAKSVIQRASRAKAEKKMYPQLSRLAGLCQRVILQPERFKELYAQAFEAGDFEQQQETAAQ